jgi:hypothetical protein
MTDYYSILELKQGATVAEIRQAYRRLAKRYHPDVNKTAGAHEKFIAISEAYEALMERASQPTPQYASADTDKEAYEEFIRRVHEKARQQAQMRYNEFVKRNEAFQQSGFSDIALLVKIISRIVALPFTIAFFAAPVVLAILFDPFFLILILFMWPVSVFLAWNIYDHRKNYFLPEHFYYNFSRIKELLVATHPTDQDCYYCANHKANSKPYRIELFKLKDIKMQFEGFRSQKANYVNDNAVILIPRSRKAFVIHVSISFIKIFALLASVFLLDVSSLMARVVIGFLAGGALGFIVLKVSRTLSNVSYLYTANLIIRVVVWLTILKMNADIHFYPFNIYAGQYMKLAVAIILLFDCFLMQLVDAIIKHASYLSVVHQHPQVEDKAHKGYRAFNEIPLLSVIYPMFRWIWG